MRSSTARTAFIRNMRVLVRYLKVLYLIDDKSQKKPDKAVEEDDKELLYLCMHRNLDENGKELIDDLFLDDRTSR